MTKEKNDDVFIDPMLQAQEVSRESKNKTGVKTEAENAYAATNAANNTTNDTEMPSKEESESDEQNKTNTEEVAKAEEIVEKDWEAEFEKMKDQALRAMAEVENIRRRTEREKIDASKYSISNFARDIITIADNIGRSLEHVPENLNEDLKSFVEGIQMTETELVRLLEKHEIKKINPKVGEDKYDHNFHEAIFEMPTDEFPAGTVAQVVQTGYILHNRLLRPARVGVSKALPAKD